MLYLELMELMNKPMMDKHLASTTFKYIKILLRSDRIKTQVGSAPLQFVNQAPLHSERTPVVCLNQLFLRATCCL